MTLPALPPARLSDGVVDLRLVEARDWVLDQAMSQDAEIVRWTPMPPSLSEQQARERVCQAIGQHATNDRAIWVIERDGERQGRAGLFARPDGAVELFYALLGTARGAGTATRAARLLTGWAVKAGADGVVLTTFPENTASQHTARRAGFRPVGRERRAIKGTERDLLLWSWAATTEGQ
jgi:RimJ/RimL family protein N-acetyltransferase